MPDTPLTICNRALQKLGAGSITSLSTSVDTSERAATMCTLYEPTLKASQQSARWNFTQRRFSLQGWSCVPVHDFNCAYLIPGEVLQVEETTLDQDVAWRHETLYCSTANVYTNILVTDQCSPMNVVVSAYVTDPGLWSPLFTEAFVTELAYLATFSITSSQSRVDGLERERDRAWKLARSRDGQEGRPLKRWLSDVLLRGRFSRSTWRDPSRLS